MAKYCSEAMEYGEAWGWSAESGSASIVAADKAIEFRILKQGRAIGGKEAESADPGFMAGAEFAVTGVFAGTGWLCGDRPSNTCRLCRWYR